VIRECRAVCKKKPQADSDCRPRRARRRVYSTAFREEEKLFPHYAAATPALDSQ
jgi:hypothetical protein